MTFNPLQQQAQCIFIADGCPERELLVFLELSCGIRDTKVWVAAKAFNTSSAEQGKGLPLAHESEERELDARRASIERENHIGHRFVSPLLSFLLSTKH